MNIPIEGFLLIVGYGLVRLAIPLLAILALCKILPRVCSSDSESVQDHTAL